MIIIPAAWEIDDRPKLLIGMPHRDTVSMEWALGFRNLQVNVSAMFTTSRGTPIDMARNEIVRSALDAKVDWIFFLDVDVTPPPDIITRLMGHNLPIVSGLYFTRAPPIEPTVWREVPPSGKAPIQFNPGEMVKADFIGMGCCLVHTSVFKNISKPYFEWTLSFENPEDMTKGRSEDFEFCRKAREKGYTIWVDTSLQCKHGIANAFTGFNGINISNI